MTLSPQNLHNTLSGKIDDFTFDRLKKYYPIATTCPTCDGTKQYVLNGETFECDCDTQRLLQRHYFAANIGREYHDICIEHFFPGENRDVVVPAIESYIANFSDYFHYGLGLTFCGPYGTGKTFAMTCVLKELVKQGHEVYFVTFDELIDTWGQAWHNDDAKRMLQEKLKKVEVLGLDELKTDGRNNMGFLASGLDHVIRHRTSNLLPTLITTNLTPNEEEREFGKAFSLLSARNKRIVLTGKDERGGQVRQTIHDLAREHERRPIC